MTVAKVGGKVRGGESKMINLSRLGVIKNSYQGDYEKVLCVCSTGCLRSPTAAVVLSQEPFNFNTRSCGLNKEFAIIPIDEGLIEWADEIVCMDLYQQHCLGKITKKPIFNLNISDIYGYRDPELIAAIKKSYQNCDNGG